MKTFIGKRGSGKTTMVIKKSAETGARIITHNSMTAYIINKQAKDLGYKIPKPMSIRTYLNKKERHNNGIILDELELILSNLIHDKIEMVTINTKEVE